MDWRVKWTDPALEDLEAALLDLSERANANVANSFHAAVFKSTKLLETFPEMGAIYEWDESRQVREIFCRRYRIFYQLIFDDRYVEILRVWHSSRREPQLPA